jgi:D-glycero-D-manno-heptose 1,7-bisphosphate phosphatase
MKSIIPECDISRRIHEKRCGVVAVAGSEVTAIFNCSHGSDDGCARRKPQPGLLQEFAPNPGCA